MIDTVRLELNWYSNPEANSSHNFRLYEKIRVWLKNNGVIYTFGWDDTGRYFPDFIVIEDTYATVFKLTFDL